MAIRVFHAALKARLDATVLRHHSDAAATEAEIKYFTLLELLKQAYPCPGKRQLTWEAILDARLDKRPYQPIYPQPAA